MHLALLRGINVGGKNVIRMADLKQAFEDLGFADVRTYIQSGNVLFRADGGGTKQLATRIETGLAERFDYRARVVVKSKRQYRDALACAPDGWGEDASRKHNAIFTVHGVRTSVILDQLPPLREELEAATCGPGVIFWSASIKDIARTTIMKLGRHRVYKQVTVRNHKTTLTLLRMMGE